MKQDIHFIGIGDAGTNVLEYFYYFLGFEAKYTYINDCLRVYLPNEIEYFNFNSEVKWSKIRNNQIPLKTYTDFKLNEDLKKIFEEGDTYILLTGLGGFIGTILTQKIINYLESKNIRFLLIASLPFQFEHKEKIKNAFYFVGKNNMKSNFLYYDLGRLKLKFGTVKVQYALDKANKEFLKLFYKGIVELDSL